MGFHKRLKEIIGSSLGAEIVEYNIEKAILDAQEQGRKPQGQFFDPFSLFLGRGYLPPQGSVLTHVDLRSMSKTPIIASIIQTRLNQVAAFTAPQKERHTLGFDIVSDDTQAQADQNRRQEIRSFMAGCGLESWGEPSFEILTRKVVRDSLVLDQMNIEVVPRRNGTPGYMVAVDAGTIRKTKESLEYAIPPSIDDPWYVQILHDRIVAEWLQPELVFGVRNPQTDIRFLGYGTSELEWLMRIVTAIVNAEKFNTSQLTQGGAVKGLLAIKGVENNSEFDMFKSDFREAMKNAAAYWSPPILRLDEKSEVDWLTLDRGNRDLEYARLFDFLVKQACGVYQIDPIEISWSIGPTGNRTTFESRQDMKIKTSQKRGLFPLLIFYADALSGVVRSIDPRYRLAFVGHGLTEEEEIEMKIKEVTNIKTLNEVREDLGLPSLGKAGEIVLHPNFKPEGESDENLDEDGNKIELDEDGNRIEIEEEEEEIFEV